MHVRPMRGRGRQRWLMTYPGSDPDVRLQPEVPLVALLRRVHLRVALIPGILGRSHDRACRDTKTFGLQMDIRRHERQAVGLMLLQQMAKRQDHRLVRCRRDSKINAHKTPHRGGLVQQSSPPGSDRLNHCYTQKVCSMVEKPTG